MTRHIPEPARAALIAAGVFLVYLASEGTAAHHNDQYVRLADALLHGRTWLVDAPGYLELLRIGHRGYVIDPPAPALLALPFVAIGGIRIHQAWVSMAAGAGAVALFWVAARRLAWPRAVSAALTITLAFGTDLWWASSNGQMWMVAHAAAVLFVMAAFAEAAGRNRAWLVGILVGLAALSRLPDFLLAPLFGFLVFRAGSRKALSRLAVFTGVVAAFAALYLVMNRLQFGSWTRLPYSAAQYADEPWFRKGRFDVSYVPRHLQALFTLGPVRIHRPPYLVPDANGFAFVAATPPVLYALRARMSGSLERASCAALVLTSIPLVTHGLIGQNQFGYRYSLDVVLPLLLLIGSGMRGRVSRPAVVLVAVAVAVNLWGTVTYNVLDTVSYGPWIL